jgi:hypothetical protein
MRIDARQRRPSASRFAEQLAGRSRREAEQQRVPERQSPVQIFMHMQNLETTKSPEHLHAVRFYQDSDSLCRIVARFLGDRLVAGEPAMIVATRAHSERIARQLFEQSVDVNEVQRRGDLLFLDARQTLDTFMLDGMPDSSRFDTTVTIAIDKVCHGRSDATIRVFGEMVDLLWKDAMHVAAIRLEMLWNQLATTKRFSLLCGYSMGNFYKDAAFRDICRHHTHVVSADDQAEPFKFNVAC